MRLFSWMKFGFTSISNCKHPWTLQSLPSFIKIHESEYWSRIWTWMSSCDVCNSWIAHNTNPQENEHCYNIQFRFTLSSHHINTFLFIVNEIIRIINDTNRINSDLNGILLSVYRNHLKPQTKCIRTSEWSATFDYCTKILWFQVVLECTSTTKCCYISLRVSTNNNNK